MRGRNKKKVSPFEAFSLVVTRGVPKAVFLTLLLFAGVLVGVALGIEFIKYYGAGIMFAGIIVFSAYFTYSESKDYEIVFGMR